MARFLFGVVAGMVITTVAGAAIGSHAQSDDVEAAAAEAGVDAQDLQGALNSTGIADPRQYLRGVGELESPRQNVTSQSYTTQSNARVACLEGKESGGANVANRRGSGAVGVLQYMVPTFQAHAREMGHLDWSPWNPDQARAVAAHDLALGRRSQWTVGGC